MHQVISVTGHRPDKLGGYRDVKTQRAIERIFTEWCELNRPALVITGMALGFDQHVARVCLELGVPYVAAIPFVGQEGQWPMSSQLEFQRLLASALEVYCVSKGGFTRAAMHARNHWMVDHAELTVALWNGSPGGTGECVAYANTVGRPVVNLWGYLLDGFVS